MENAGKVVAPALFVLLAAFVFSSEWVFVFVFVAVCVGACVLGLAVGVLRFWAATPQPDTVQNWPSHDELCPSARAQLVLQYLQV